VARGYDGHLPGLQFARTFDTIYDNQVQEYMVLFAMRTQEWAEAETVRPPLNLLAIPLQSLRWCIKSMRRPKVNNDGGSQNETFYKVFEKAERAADSDKVEKWIKVASAESEPGPDEDKQGRDSMDAYLHAFSDIVVCQLAPSLTSLADAHCYLWSRLRISVAYSARAALRCHLWLGHQVFVYVNMRGSESSAEEDESWRRAMKRAVIDKIKELGSKTDSIDSRMKELDAKIDAQNGKIDELIGEVRCALRTMRT
jgi:hypothetical protein